MLQTVQESSTGGCNNYHIIYFGVTVHILSQIANVSRSNPNEYFAYQIFSSWYITSICVMCMFVQVHWYYKCLSTIYCVSSILSVKFFSHVGNPGDAFDQLFCVCCSWSHCHVMICWNSSKNKWFCSRKQKLVVMVCSSLFWYC